MSYPINVLETEKFKKYLSVEKYNNIQSINILEEVIKGMESFNGKTLNKRVETHLRKHLAEVFGQWNYSERNPGETWGLDKEENKMFNNVDCYLYQDYGKRLNFTFTGKKYESVTDWNSEYPHTRTWQVTESRGERIELWGIESPEDVTKQAKSKIAYLIAENVKIDTNKRRIISMVKNHNKLVQQISDHNDGVSYVLADHLKIK